MGRITDLLANPEELNHIVKELFSLIDSDDSGYVEESELRILMTRIANQCNVEAPSEDDVKEAIKAIDSNNDGRVSFKEFKILVVEMLKSLADNEQSEDM